MQTIISGCNFSIAQSRKHLSGHNTSCYLVLKIFKNTFLKNTEIAYVRKSGYCIKPRQNTIIVCTAEETLCPTNNLRCVNYKLILSKYMKAML